MKLLGILFGAKAPPETIESLEEELKRVEYVIVFGYNQDQAKLAKEKAEIEKKITALRK